MGHNKQNKTGFTLIELLVVVAIIALLIAILLPSLASARGEGNRASCLSNLRQIGLSASMYVQDWNIYPISITGTEVKWKNYIDNPAQALADNNGNLGYAVALLPYHNNKKVYDCPILANLGCDISYCYNWIAGNDGVAYESGNKNTLTPSRIEMTERFVLLYDQPLRPTGSMGMYNDIDPSDEWEGGDWRESGWGTIRFYDGVKDTPEHPVKGPHKDGHDILFADGHAQWYLKWDDRNMTRYYTTPVPVRP